MPSLTWREERFTTGAFPESHSERVADFSELALSHSAFFCFQAATSRRSSSRRASKACFTSSKISKGDSGLPPRFLIVASVDAPAAFNG